MFLLFQLDLNLNLNYKFYWKSRKMLSKRWNSLYLKINVNRRYKEKWKKNISKTGEKKRNHCNGNFHLRWQGILNEDSGINGFDASWGMLNLKLKKYKMPEVRAQLGYYSRDSECTHRWIELQNGYKYAFSSLDSYARLLRQRDERFNEL